MNPRPDIAAAQIELSNQKINAAAEALKNNDVATAKKYFESARTIILPFPKTPDVWRNIIFCEAKIGECHHALQEFEESIKWYKKACANCNLFYNDASQTLYRLENKKTFINFIIMLGRNYKALNKTQHVAAAGKRGLDLLLGIKKECEEDPEGVVFFKNSFSILWGFVETPQDKKEEKESKAAVPVRQQVGRAIAKFYNETRAIAAATPAAPALSLRQEFLALLESFVEEFPIAEKKSSGKRLK